MTDIFLFLILELILVFTNIFWYFQCKKTSDEWYALLKQQTEDWREHCKYINKNWSDFYKKLIEKPEEAERDETK